MTVRERVTRSQRMLVAGVLLSAIAWGAGVYLASLAVVAAVASLMQNPQLAGTFALPISLTLGLSAMLVVLWRGRRVASASRVALWIEERLPTLHYALITAIEPGLDVDVPALESAVGREDVSGVTTVALRRSILPAAGVLLAGAALLYVLPAPALGRPSLLGRVAGSATGGIPAGSRLNDLKVEMIPPAYAGQRAQSLDDPESVRALVGSRILVTGTGSNEGVVARIAEASASVSGSRASWRTQVVMPSKPAALTLTDRSYERVIVLEPQTDEPPKVVLTSPMRDTTLRTPQLVVKLHAETTDDVALTTGYYEYLITSGSGEIFTARTVNTAPVEFGHARTGALDATLDLKSLKLTQGDVVSIRAIVRDANTLSGPSIGTSDTRTIRIARAGEYDSVSIEAAAAPIPLDSSAVSQRMLIAMTEKLVSQQQKLTRQDLVKRSTEIGNLEDRIRKRVHEILFEAEDRVGQEQPGDPLPTIEEMEPPDDVTERKSPDLSAAYNALWEAVRSLQIAQPAPALPPMRVALKALDRVRLANRLYLRGMPPKIIVDLQRVRLTGKEKGSSSARTPRSFADSIRVRLSARFNAALDLIEKQPARAMTELALIRVDALSSLPEFAAALGQATDAIRAGRDVTLPLMRARRALEGAPNATPGLPLWSGG